MPTSNQRQPPTPQELQKVRSILIIHFRYLGDMVLLSSLFHNLHLHLPHAHLTALTDEAYTPILRNIPDLNEVIPFPRQQAQRGPFPRRMSTWIRLMRQLRARHFDVVIDTANTSTSRIMVSLLKATWRVGYRPPARKEHKSPYNVFAEPFRPDVPHYVDHYLEPVKALGLPIVERSPHLKPLPEDEQIVTQLLQSHNLKPQAFVAIHAGSRVGRKCWPAANFAQVIDVLESEYNLRTVLVGSGEERAIGDAIHHIVKHRPVDFIDKLSVGESVALLHQSRLFIGNDSGPMHIAAAGGVPVVAIFGPSEANLWAPIGDHNIVLETTCQCGLNMKIPTACDIQGPQCLKKITVENVLNAVRKLLSAQ